MRIPENLILPAAEKSFYQEDFEKDPEQTCVAAAFFKAKEQYTDQAMKEARRAVEQGASRKFNEAEQEKFQNELLDRLRPHIDRAMQKALIRNGGKVDSFPPAKLSGWVSLSKTTYSREEKEDFTLSADEKAPWQEENFEFQSFPVTLDFFQGVESENHVSFFSYYENASAEKLIEKEKELRKRRDLVFRRGKERLKKFIGSLPTILALTLDALILYSVFGNKELYSAITQHLPYYEICSKFTGISFVHLIGLPVLSLFISAFLTGFLDPVVIRGVSKKQAATDYEEFIESKEYLTAKKQLDEEKPRYDKLMREFYKAWYRHAKNIF